MLAYLRRLHDVAVYVCGRLDLRQPNPADRAIVVMYGNIVELSGAYLQLAETAHWVGTKTIARACLEASVHLQNLLQDDQYINTLEAISQLGIVRRFRDADDANNDFLRDIRAIPNRAELRRAAEVRLEVLQNEGHRPRNIFEAFELANVGNVYRSVYGVLSNEAHSGIDGLYARHVGPGHELQFAIYRDVDLADRYPEIDLVASILVVAHDSIHQRLDLPARQEATALMNEFHELRRQNVVG